MAQQAGWSVGVPPPHLWKGEGLGVWGLGEGEQRDPYPGPEGSLGQASCPASTWEARLATLVSWVRRQLFFLAVRQQSRLLSDCLQQLGDGAKEARSRRDWAVHMEAGTRREMRA